MGLVWAGALLRDEVRRLDRERLCAYIQVTFGIRQALNYFYFSFKRLSSGVYFSQRQWLFSNGFTRTLLLPSIITRTRSPLYPKIVPQLPLSAGDPSSPNNFTRSPSCISETNRDAAMLITSEPANFKLKFVAPAQVPVTHFFLCFDPAEGTPENIFLNPETGIKT